MEYKFDRNEHIHTLDGKPLHGVTTVLSVIAKPMLIQWAANQAVEYVQSNFFNQPISRLPELLANGQTLLDEAKTAHRKKKEAAGDWGTRMHEAIENYIKSGMESIEDDQKEVFEKLKKWIEENNVKFLASEKHVWSEKLWIGGICDIVLELNGKKYIGDFKTSSGIYNEAFFQIAAYDLCMQEMGLHQDDDIEGYIVINLKKDGKLDFKIAMDKELNQQAFLSALSLHKIINQLKS